MSVDNNIGHTVYMNSFCVHNDGMKDVTMKEKNSIPMRVEKYYIYTIFLSVLELNKYSHTYKINFL